jgi:hypothetical protein
MCSTKRYMGRAALEQQMLEGGCYYVMFCRYRYFVDITQPRAYAEGVCLTKTNECVSEHEAGKTDPIFS